MHSQFREESLAHRRCIAHVYWMNKIIIKGSCADSPNLWCWIRIWELGLGICIGKYALWNGWALKWAKFSIILKSQHQCKLKERKYVFWIHSKESQAGKIVSSTKRWPGALTSCPAPGPTSALAHSLYQLCWEGPDAGGILKEAYLFLLQIIKRHLV